MPELSNRIPRAILVDANRTNHFNFLRLIFASLVILSHTFELIDGNRDRELLTRLFGSISFAEVAVDGFFLLSGYLIVKSWDSAPHILPFMSKRILRIYPGFIVASLICALVVGPLGAEPVAYFFQLDPSRVVYGILRLWGPLVPPVFAGQPHPSVNGAMWTIPFEFACYLSVLVLGLSHLVKHREGWLVITAGIFAAVICQKLGFQPSLFGYSFNLEHPLLRLGSFFYTGGSYYLLRDRISFRPRVAQVFGVVVFIAMFNSASAEPVLAVLGGYMLFHFAFSPIALLRPFQTLPDVSYGLYLYGWPIQKLLIWHFPGLSAWSVFILALVGGILAGLVSWHLVEKPFLKLKLRGAWPAFARYNTK